MADKSISSSEASNLKNKLTDYSVDVKSVDGALDQKETYYDIPDWTQWFGYYTTIPELHAAINAKATWTVGKGYQSDDETTLILDAIKGWGKDTFNTILENMIRTSIIAGDAFAELITNKDDKLINIKPLDPEFMRIVVNKQGLIIRYEQRNKVNKSVKKFKIEEIFHLARNRVADQIHGTSIIPAIEEIIKMRNEAMTDYRKVMHRYVKPMILWHLDTDDPKKIADHKRKTDAATEDGENMYVPMKSVEHEIVATAPNATLSPLAWIDSLNDYFFQAVSMPAVILGSSKSLTEAAVKIVFMAFQRATEEDQLQIEEQFLAQTNLVIKLQFPAIIQNELLSDAEQQPQANAPQVQQEQAVEPNDTTAEVEGRK